MRVLLCLALWCPSMALATTMLSVDDVEAGASDRPADGDYRPDLDDPSAYIIHGERASRRDYPETGGLLFGGTVTTPGMFGQPSQTVTVRQFACSSTLIAPDVVLLAAHCVDPMVLSQGGSVQDLEFRWSRQVDLREPSNPYQDWPEDAIVATEAVFPDAWSIANMQNFSLGGPKHDIALLFLSEVVPDIEPAVLVAPDEAGLVEEGAIVDVVGWGMSVPIGIADALSPPGADEYGRKMWGTTQLAEVGDYEMQVGDAPSATRKCRGDSGGPTFMEVDAGTVETYRLIGVTSRAADFNLCETSGGYDTRVDAYLDWIDEEMRAACADGTRVWCDEPGILLATPLSEALDDPAEAGEKPGTCQTVPSGALGWLGLTAVGMLLRRRSQD